MGDVFQDGNASPVGGREPEAGVDLEARYLPRFQIAELDFRVNGVTLDTGS